MLSIHFVETIGINFHSIQSITGNFLCDASFVINLRIIANPAQQSINYARSAARPPGNFARAFRIDFHAQDLCRTPADYVKVFGRIKVEMEDDAKTSAQRSGYQSRTRSCADQGELWQFQLNRPCRRALAYEQIELIVLHSRIKFLFQRW